MNSVLQVFASPGWTLFVQALLHTLWQGVIIALLLGCYLRSLPAHRTNTRYALTLLALASLLLSGLVTWAILGLEKPQAPQPSSATAAVGESQSKTLIANTAKSSPLQFPSDNAQASVVSVEPTHLSNPNWIMWGATVWICGCGMMTCRLLSGLVDLRRVRKRCRIVLDPAVDIVIERLQTAMGMARRIVVLTGDHIRMPSVFGVFLPKLLLPPALLTGIPVAQLEAILAHELAHIRRHDFLVNLAQEMIEAFLFFNPAVWWINRQIRHEREACCDRLAIEATGQKETYARVLTDWAERCRDESFVSELAPAFGGANPGGPLDRLRRLLTPGYRPMIRLPWYSFAGVFVLSGLCLFGLWRGTSFAVAVAAKILTPAERVEKMAEIQRSHGIKEIGERQEYTEKDKIRVSGIIRTEDGSPVPSRCHIYGDSRRPSVGIGWGTLAKDGRFSDKVDFGQIYLFVKVDGFAPASLGPLETTPGGSITNLELVLKRGFDAKIRIVDAENQPIPSVAVETSHYIAPNTSLPLNLKTDAQGEILVKDCLTNLVWDFRATVEGFQYDELKNVRLKPDESVIWKLREAKPASGIVVSKKTGSPITGAKVQLLWREGAYSGGWAFRSKPLLATTDNQGRFTIRQLNDNTLYVLFVEAPGFAPHFLRKVISGQEGLKVEMGPELVIKGKITGDLSLLPKWEKAQTIVIHPSMKLGFQNETSYGLHTNIPVQIRDGIGYFEYHGLWEGDHGISVQGFHTNFAIYSPKEDFHLKLPPATSLEEVSAKRKVIFRFHVPAGHPIPTNTFRFEYSSDTEHMIEHKKAPIKNGEAHVELSVPGHLSLEQDGLIGYWIQPDHAVNRLEAGPPLTVDVSLIPAGTIFGKVLEADGAEASSVMVSVREIKKSPLRKEDSFLNVRCKDTASSDDVLTRFTAQSLPLGGKYQIVAHRSPSYVVSEVISLTEKQPLREITLRFARGEDVVGRVMDGQGNPLSAIHVRLSYAPQPNHGFGGSTILTDGDGIFRFAKVNPNAPGSYSVGIEKVPGFQPYQQKLDFRKLPLMIQLKDGEKISGQVVDAATGWPIPGAEVYAMPSEGKLFTSWLNPDAKTNEKGEFLFSNMEKAEYKIQCRDGVIIGKSGKPEFILASAGKSEPAVLRVKLYEWSKLKPNKPAE